MNKKPLIIIGLTVLAIILSMIAHTIEETMEAKVGLMTSLLFFGWLCYYYTRNK